MRLKFFQQALRQIYAIRDRSIESSKTSIKLISNFCLVEFCFQFEFFFNFDFQMYETHWRLYFDLSFF